jgi:2-C-methyl-D-erythritol 4-phosphate cytidylyltransferase
VEGEETNIKITRPTDLLFAEQVIKQSEQNQFVHE